MYVILTILKILGIILLVLLGLLLFIVFSVLFVPVRYRLEGEKSSPGWSGANGKVKFSWLLHLIHLRIQYQEKELDWECYLFGVPLKKAGAAVREWKKKRRKKKVQEQKERRKKAVQQKNEPEKRTAAKKKGQEKPLQIEEKTEIKTAERKQQEKEKVSDKLSRFWNRCKKIVGSILGFPGKLKKKLTNIRLTFRGFCDKIKQWQTLWNEESTLAALHFLTEKGRKLIRHVLPRKIRGSITFGCEDPALTGQILGAVAIAYPLYGKGVAVYPRFEEKILEGQLQMKGRIVVACLLWLAWKIYRNPDVRKTLKKIR